jgi:hypothetical protein
MRHRERLGKPLMLSSAWLLLVTAFGLLTAAACGGKTDAADTATPADARGDGEAPEQRSALELVEGGTQEQRSTLEVVEGEAPAPDVCVPSCENEWGEWECGWDDGCGGACECPEGYTCYSGDGDYTLCFSHEIDCPGVCEERGAGCGEAWTGLDEDVPMCQCGDCPEGQVCAHLAEFMQLCCSPSCPENECGDDGCGGTCKCQGGLECVDAGLAEEGGPYYCLPTCTMVCANPQDALGWAPELQACETVELVTPTVACDCGPCDDGNPCTDDGCLNNADYELEGGYCSYLPDDANLCDDGNESTIDTCEEGVCVSCVPDCAGKACGDDGCGGSCGACSDDCPLKQECIAGQCVTLCEPQCEGKACGDDGCGCSCATCSDELMCVEHQCISPAEAIPTLLVEIEDGGCNKPVSVQLSAIGWDQAAPNAGADCYLNGELAGSTSGPEFDFEILLEGMQKACCVLTWKSSPVQLCSAWDCVSIKLGCACSSSMDCDDGNPCSVDVCVQSAEGKYCKYAKDIYKPKCCMSNMDCECKDGLWGWCDKAISTCVP